MERAFVICNNDAIEFVVFGGKASALERMLDMQEAWERENPQMAAYGFWHLHEVGCHFDGPVPNQEKSMLEKGQTSQERYDIDREYRLLVDFMSQALDTNLVVLDDLKQAGALAFLRHVQRKQPEFTIRTPMVRKDGGAL